MTMVCETFNYKEITYLKGWAKAKSYSKLILAINLAEKLHDNVTRKSGEPYISHPVRIASAIISLGIDDEDTICAAILHDIVEDTYWSINDIEKEFGKDIALIVQLLSKDKDLLTEDYYNGIKTNAKACIVKIADRCHNISTIHFFSLDKIEKYIEETIEYVLPLCSYTYNTYIEYADYVYTMKYQIESILDISTTLIKYIKEK